MGSRSVEDLISSSCRMRVSKSSMTVGEVARQLPPQVTTCAEYSEVWDPGDSGISSTSDSTVSYNNKKADLDMEDLSKVPWYEAEMPRWRSPVRSNLNSLCLLQRSRHDCAGQ